MGRSASSGYNVVEIGIIVHVMYMEAGRPPELGREAVATLVRDLFPFSQVNEHSVKKLPSYDDRNFYFCGILEDNASGNNTKEYVLKLANSSFPPENFGGLNCVMKYLKSKGFNCPCPLIGRKGSDAEFVSETELSKLTNDQTGEDAKKFCVRVLTYIPGELMDKIDKIHITPRLLYDVGNCIGSMDKVLQEFSHPVLDHRVFLDWDLMHFLTLRKYLPALDDPKKRRMAETVLSGFEDNVSPNIPLMKQGIIYGDANGLNIIVGKENGKYSLTGVIDFGDCLKTCYVFELGIMLGYTMLEKQNPVQLVCPMLSGYLDAFPMSDVELGCLYYVVLARLCQSAILGEYSYKQEPWNTYLLTTPTHAWKMIEEMLGMGKQAVDKIWEGATKAGKNM